MRRPEVIALKYHSFDPLYYVNSLGKKRAWVSGNTSSFTLVEIGGNSDLKVLKTVQTAYPPTALTGTSFGDLFYTDYENNSVNLYQTEADQVKVVFCEREWCPSGICYTSGGDVWVAIYNGPTKQFKIVCFSYSKGTLTQKRTIPRSGQSNPFRGDGDRTSLQVCVNRNGDVCVVDSNAKDLLVFNKAGDVKSKYSHRITIHITFDRSCIATDSQSHILVSDPNEEGAYGKIHILDQNANHRFAILNCYLRNPLGISVNSDDRLWVVEEGSKTLKLIQYMQAKAPTVVH